MCVVISWHAQLVMLLPVMLEVWGWGSGGTLLRSDWHCQFLIFYSEKTTLRGTAVYPFLKRIRVENLTFQTSRLLLLHDWSRCE